MMTIKKKKLIMLIIIIAVVSIISIIGLIVLATNTNIFKSEEAQIKEYIGQAFDKFANVVNFDYEEQIFQELEEQIYESNTEVIFNSENKDGKIKLLVDSQVDNENDYNYKNMKLSYRDKSIAEIEYLKEDEIFGLRFKNIVEQFISIRNENLDELVEKLEGFDEETYAIPEKLEEIDIYEIIKLSEEEKETIKEKYIDIMYKYIQNKEIETQKDSMVTINEKTVTANAYILKIKKSEVSSMYTEILENLKNEEIILNKISSLEDIYGDYILNQENLLKDYYTNIIDEEIIKLEDEQEEYEIKITMYETSNGIICIKLKHELREINIELQNEIVINDIIMGEEENSKQIYISKNQGQLKLEINKIVGESESNITIEESMAKDDNNIKTQINILYNEEYENNVYITNNIEIIEEIEEKYNIEENNVILNDLSEEKLNAVVNVVANAIKEEFVKKMKILQKGLDIDITGDMIINEEGKTETQKNLFNAKFEFYAGENISKENLESLLEVVKQNLKEVEFISENTEDETEEVTEETEEVEQNEEEQETGQYNEEITESQEEIEEKEITEIRFKIKEDSEYNGSFDEIDEVLQKSKTYKVEIEYNSDTELIEYVIIKLNDVKSN